MAADRPTLALNDGGSTDHQFVLVPTGKGGRGFTLEQRPWQPGDPQAFWRVPLHPGTGGLGVNRLGRNPTTYAKANADASWPGMLLFPPKVRTLTPTNSGTITHIRDFSSKTYALGGRYMNTLDWSLPSLTTANVITDATRATATAGDGLSSDSSYGIWEATTNLITNGGGETNDTGWVDAGATVSRITTQFKFGAACLEAVTANAAANEGGYHNFTATAAVYTVSAWVRGASGTVRLAVRDNAGANPQTGSAVTLSTTWQRVQLTTTALTAATWRLYVETDTQQNITFQFDGVQAELQPLATPYVETNGGTASRSAARVQMSASVLDETQCWVAMRVRMGWGNANEPNGTWTSSLFTWKDNDNNKLFMRYQDNVDTWTCTRVTSGTFEAAGIVDAVTRGDFVTVIGAYTSTTVKISVDGSAFTSASSTNIPTLSATSFDIGSDNGTDGHFDGDVKWMMCGLGYLTDADAATIHAFGNTDPTIGGMPVSAQTQAIWTADTAAVAHWLGDPTLAEDKDFGSGKAGVDMDVLNTELVVAMGESEKIWKRTTSTWSQASDNTFAIALGLVDARLWRAETANLISNASTTPLTLTNWVPTTSASKYKASDSTYSVHDIKDYGGVPWALKGDGAYQPDPTTKYRNQTPQMRVWPHEENAKGAFLAQASLWVPSAMGLLRVQPGSSLPFGPEKSYRPDYRFWVRGGVEFGDGVLYLLCTDQGAVEQTFVCKMVRVGEDRYIYHEWARLGGTTKGYAAHVTTLPTQPTLVFGYGATLKYMRLGRGGGRDVDDPSYEYGTSMTYESGRILPGPDLGVVCELVGVETVLNLRQATTGASVSWEYKADDGTYASLLDTQEGGGSAAISSTTNFEVVRRYAPGGAQGQFFEFRLTGTLVCGAGTNRPEILEAYAFGTQHPENTDIISMMVLADDNASINGIRLGRTAEETERQFRDWKNEGTELTFKFEDYETNRTVRVKVSAVEETEIEAKLGEGNTTSIVRGVSVAFVRVDRAGAYADA